MVHRFFKGNTALSVLINDLETMGQGDIQLAEVRVHLSAAGGAVGVVTLTIKVDSGEGSEYTATLSSTDMTALADLRYAPDRWPFLRVKDHILIEYANGSSRTWGLEVIYKAAEA
jgi:hypothetical protein